MNQIDVGGKGEIIQGPSLFTQSSGPTQAPLFDQPILRYTTTAKPNLDSLRAASPPGYAAPWPESESALEITLLYEDARTEAWTRQLTEVLTDSIRMNPVHGIGWKISDLTQKEELAEAVCATSRADVIVTALYAAQELPVGFHSWVDAWLQRRPQLNGIFVGLVATLEGAEGWCETTENLLTTIARRGALELFIGRFELRQEGLGFPGPWSSTHGAGAIPFEAYDHWGLNE